ncbi:MAG: hypothetical protein HUU25_03205 [Candidatus Sumerlaeia bacterium]|nr:hypothetical protein [Candidatus Sumerlaeia bacterium]
MRRPLLLIPALGLVTGCAWVNPKIDRWVHEYDYGYRDYRMAVDLDNAEYEYMPPMETPSAAETQMATAPAGERLIFWPYPMGRQAHEMVH